ncbi:MAG: TIGR02266 family protein, partial [Desulfuromonadales bacterium]|nr:TIGR02266 family protein [Desulfuromonadales bacterium]
MIASNGAEAFEIIRNAKPDIVFMDLYMPLLNGDECCREIKKSPELKHIPVVMVTHGGDEEAFTRCWDAGCNDIVSKPINQALLISMAKKYLDIQIRREPRCPAKLKVNYGAENSALTDYTVNLSTGGLFLAAADQLPLGTTLVISFNLPDIQEPVQCKAKVVWLNKSDNLVKQDLPPGMGVQFIDMTLSSMDAIRNYIKTNNLKAD